MVCAVSVFYCGELSGVCGESRCIMASTKCLGRALHIKNKSFVSFILWFTICFAVYTTFWAVQVMDMNVLPLTREIGVLYQMNSTDVPIVDYPPKTTPVPCKPMHNIVFIKTHKTGSSTIATILERFGYLRNLTFGVPATGHAFPETQRFNPARIFQKDLKSKSGVVVWEALGGYNILTNHARYSHPVMAKLIPGAVFLTILRHPKKQMESAFNYFPEFASAIKKKYPGVKPLEAYLKNLPTSFLEHPAFRKAFLKNGQMYDLGLDVKMQDNETLVNHTIEAMSQNMDLVLINEYFDESLIVLKNILCWDFQDIVYISKGVRKPFVRTNVTSDMEAKILKWNHIDLRLYNHFNRTLWEKIRHYGAAFQSDLEKFRQLKDNVTKRCLENATERLSGHKESIYTFKGSRNSECEELVRYDAGWVNAIRQRMKDQSTRFLKKVDAPPRTNVTKQNITSKVNTVRKTTKTKSVKPAQPPNNKT